ncbi:C-GCAxxG-C-C family protein [Oscillospiraceae bacterium MB08-C2-2]|nr:C-GCAxxG-C-C family protein [Oscillospiraceae bacterium MB08-C2-2]
MDTLKDTAQNNFHNGMNCAQAVVTVFSEKYGMSKDLALRLAGGFGGGCRTGELCGAVSGAIMVIGLKHGPSTPSDAEAKAICGAQTKNFIDRFKERNHSVTCRELLGCEPVQRDLLPAEQQAELKEVCTDLVSGAVELLEQMDY